jgi:hypothetical protein
MLSSERTWGVVVNRFRRGGLIAAALVALTVALFAGPTGSGAASRRTVTIRTLAHRSVIADIWFYPPPAGYVPTISGDRAVTLGRGEFIGLPRPSSIAATLVADPTNGPAWIVSLRGVCEDSHGPGSCFTELNVVVSARTGAFLYEFSYR